MSVRVPSILPLTAASLIALAQPSVAEVDTGAYLAARQAISESSFEEAADYFLRALDQDAENPALLENALYALIGQGDFETALPIAERLAAQGNISQVANIIVTVEDARGGNWDELLSRLESGLSVSGLIDGSIQAWAAMGQGRMTAALDNFDAMMEEPSLRAFAIYQKALALSLVGDYETAIELLDTPDSRSLMRSPSAVQARAQVLSQLGRRDEAIAFLREFEGANIDATVADQLERLESGESLPFTIIDDPASGIAEAFLTVAMVLQDEASATYTLVYARAAQRIAPDNTDAILMTATLLEELGRYDLAGETFALVDPEDPNFVDAELGRADVLRADGRMDTAIEVLQQLARREPVSGFVAATLGDYLRGNEDMKEAEAAYTRALELYGSDDPSQWFIYFARGITRERQGAWDGAESDFRRALEINPGHPSVLNYLGYSLVERQEKLDEALAMIEEAVAARPDSGAIVDSLGWVLFRLGRYDEAVGHLERAAELEATDPVVNDHLGDVFWVVGRTVEARFQWQRALSFEPEEADAQRIRRKLDIGLDAVLAEEGADPINYKASDD